MKKCSSWECKRDQKQQLSKDLIQSKSWRGKDSKEKVSRWAIGKLT
jgi:hypothetical protein